MRVSGWRKRFVLNPHWPFVATGIVLVLIGLKWLLSGPGTAQIDSFNQCANAGYPITDTNPPACDTGSGLLLGPAATPGTTPPPSVNQPFNLLVDGDSGGAYPKGQQIITTQTGWQAYWHAVHASLPAIPPILSVDFTSGNVIALSSGPEATNGYTLEVTGVSVSSAGSVVDAIESIPSITCKVADTPTNRYYIAETAKLPQPVTFKVTTSPRECPQ